MSFLFHFGSFVCLFVFEEFPPRVRQTEKVKFRTCQTSVSSVERNNIISSFHLTGLEERKKITSSGKQGIEFTFKTGNSVACSTLGEKGGGMASRLVTASGLRRNTALINVRERARERERMRRRGAEKQMAQPKEIALNQSSSNKSTAAQESV